MIGSRILTDDNDCIRFIEVVEGYGPLADADRFAQRRTARLVTHVRTIRQIVRAKLAYEELIQKSRFVAGAAGSVKDRLIRVVERVELSGEQLERVVPTHRFVVSRIAMQQHRVRESSLRVQPLIRLLSELLNPHFLKNSGVTRLVVASSATCLAPFSQNSKCDRCLSGSGHAQPGQSMPPD